MCEAGCSAETTKSIFLILPNVHIRSTYIILKNLYEILHINLEFPLII